MKRLLIVWHSMTGGAHQMAQAAAQAARAEPDVDVRLQAAAQTTAEDVLAADGYLFVTPENLASMAGLMKDFFDRTYYAALDRIVGRPYAILVCAGTDGTGAVRQIQRIATGLRLKEIAAPVIVRTGAQTPEAILAPKTLAAADLARCAEVGAALAAGLSAGIF
ncbi:MAG: NAD(P)H-dependent oxidoreductase [Sutterellaceae bacterium]|nr:NAD(P)H-dependent oxidoreductase [Burkholderiaceae bacterium]MDW8428912.1 NAD(P)H-dependent oxidoreductase [Sutterellaceae bacterium]